MKRKIDQVENIEKIHLQLKNQKLMVNFGIESKKNYSNEQQGMVNV